MKSLYQFIITPLEYRYDNIKQIGNKEFIINTTIENHSFVSKRGKVIAVPSVYKTEIKVGDEGVIEDAKFKTFGCGSAIASSSLITEWVKGKKIDEANKIKNTEIANHLALPPVKIHCSVLAEDAIKAAIANYKEKKQ